MGFTSIYAVLVVFKADRLNSLGVWIHDSQINNRFISTDFKHCRRRPRAQQLRRRRL